MTNSDIKTFVSRIEALEADKRDLASDIKDKHADTHRGAMMEPMPAGVRVHLTGTKADRLARHNLLLNAAHCAFDRLWTDVNGAVAPPKEGQARRAGGRSIKARVRIMRRQRPRAYAWLADRLGIPVAACHFGRLDDAQLERVIELCRDADPAGIKGWQEPG